MRFKDWDAIIPSRHRSVLRSNENKNLTLVEVGFAQKFEPGSKNGLNNWSVMLFQLNESKLICDRVLVWFLICSKVVFRFPVCHSSF
jgi:hypothetical protein